VSALLRELIAILYAPLGAYGALVEGLAVVPARDGRTEATLVA
jgi:hypothetical protein